jgi:hypothetical protein
LRPRLLFPGEHLHEGDLIAGYSLQGFRGVQRGSEGFKGLFFQTSAR